MPHPAVYATKTKNTCVPPDEDFECSCIAAGFPLHDPRRNRRRTDDNFHAWWSLELDSVDNSRDVGPCTAGPGSVELCIFRMMRLMLQSARVVPTHLVGCVVLGQIPHMTICEIRLSTSGLPVMKDSALREINILWGKHRPKSIFSLARLVVRIYPRPNEVVNLGASHCAGVIGCTKLYKSQTFAIRPLRRRLLGAVATAVATPFRAHGAHRCREQGAQQKCDPKFQCIHDE